MRVYRDLDSLPLLEGSVITVGSFDGLHAGHQKILKKLKQLSKSVGSQNVIITFHPHPRSVVYPKDNSLRLLSSIQEKEDLFASYEVDILVIVPFTIEFSQLSPIEYIESFLVDKFHPKHIVIGYDHKFGLNRAGDISLLKAKAPNYGYEVTEITKHEVEQITISSTRIRKAINEGDLETANSLLNRPYALSGTVVKGKKLGTELGFPTANVSVEEKKKLIPKDGIYACHIVVDRQQYKGMLYIGDVPTLGTDNPKTIEVNIFDFDKDIYEERIEIKLLKYLRDDKKFDGLEALKTQLGIDKLDSLKFFEGGGMGKMQSIDPRTTIAILNYNTSHHLETFMPSVSFSSNNHFETVVIDNGSTDDSIEVLEEWFPEVKIIQHDKNHGFAGGYNLGLSEVKSKYLILLNSDVEVTEGWLDPLIAYLDAHPDCGAVMPKILSYEEKSKFEYAGASGGQMDYLGYPFCRGRLFDTVEIDEGQYEEIHNIFWASGAAFVVRAELFTALGGFDKDYFAHQEEIDLCWRMQKAGYNLAVIPSSVVYHLGGGTLDYGNARKVFLNFRNSLSTIFKNEKASAVFWKIPLRLILDGIAGIKFLLGGEWKSTFAIIKAHFAFYGSLPRLISKRKKNKELIAQVSIDSKHKPAFYNKSILIQYYLLGKKKYSQIAREVYEET